MCELIKNEEVQQFLVEKALSPEALATKLEELKEEKKIKRDNPNSPKYTPKVKKIMALSGKAAKERFKELQEESGTVEIAPLDLLKGALATDNFIASLEPVWAHLREK